jgi:signal transduction histidine kinase/CheY-like chemotaxis protein
MFVVLAGAERVFALTGGATLPSGEQVFIWLHALSDLAIGLSYLVISATLLVLYLRLRRHLPLQWVIPAFGLFIVACGGTHIIHVALSFDLPVLGLAAVIQGLTVGASLATAVALPPLVPKVVALFEDARLSRRRQRQLEGGQAEKLRAIGQLASGVAHDLNQSLGIISGYSELAAQALERPTIEKDALREDLALITRAAQDGGETVARLVLFAHGRPEGEPEPFDTAVVLHEAARLTMPRWNAAARPAGRRIHVRVEAAAPACILGWPTALREALTNLVFNAVDALPHGGVVTLGTHRRGGDVEVRVGDDGIGMAPELQARIFEPFFTTKGAAGTGLGLAMVHGIVERHHGSIRVDSAPGIGTTFVMRFPESSVAPVAEAPTSPAPTGLHVLAVDDEPALAALAAALLRSAGYTAVTATSGEQALERLSESAFDLVVSDLGLGDGINGWELAARVGRDYVGTRFILATGWGAEIDLDDARSRGVADVLSKPYRAAQLRAAVAAAFDAHSAASA